MRSILSFSWLLLLGGCATTPTAVYYKNGIQYVPGMLELKQRPNFRFVERWHISFAWLSGTQGTNDCHFGKNPFKGKAEYGILAADDNAPLWHWRGAIVGPYINDRKPFPGKLQISVSGNLATPGNAATLGQKNAKGEVNYAKHCSASLSESFTSASATIVNAKMHDNAQSLVEGARNVQIGSNQWKVMEDPLSDYSGKEYGNQPLLERWVLEIPQTDYWMIFTFYASKQFSYVERREAYKRAHDLFREAVASVSLKPITPIVDQEKIIRPEQCVRLHPISPWICPFNEESWLKR